MVTEIRDLEKVWKNHLILLLEAVSDLEMFSQLVALLGAQVGLQGRRVVDELNLLAFVVDGSAFVVENDGSRTIHRR